MPELGFLSFLSEPWFVIPWYGAAAVSAGWAVYDMRHHNRHLNQALKWAWPIIIIFFSVLGLLLYVTTSRPPGIEKIEDSKREKEVFERYAQSQFRKVTGSVIHCVGGDGLGIISAMIAARLLGMTFWEEFWLEYLVGFLFGWLIFQLKAMTMMADSFLKALWMAFRGEFFSMMTVMAGMGVVMAFVTPLVVGEQPKPNTFAFWGFAALGLLVGYVLTYPMNWALVKVGFKHGMG